MTSDPRSFNHLRASYSSPEHAVLDGRAGSEDLNSRAVPRPITRLSDHFGQFDLLLICGKCNHRREVDPVSLAKLCRVARDALIAEVVLKLRCSKCGAKQCTATANLPKRPRRYSSLPR